MTTKTTMSTSGAATKKEEPRSNNNDTTTMASEQVAESQLKLQSEGDDRQVEIDDNESAATCTSEEQNNDDGTIIINDTATTISTKTNNTSNTDEAFNATTGKRTREDEGDSLDGCRGKKRIVETSTPKPTTVTSNNTTTASTTKVTPDAAPPEAPVRLTKAEKEQVLALVEREWEKNPDVEDSRAATAAATELATKMGYEWGSRKRYLMVMLSSRATYKKIREREDRLCELEIQRLEAISAESKANVEWAKNISRNIVGGLYSS